MILAARSLGLVTACTTLLIAGAVIESASAQGQCKDDVVTAAGRSKSRPFAKMTELEGRGSAMADAVVNWQKEVREKYGDQWDSWSRAKGTNFECAPTKSGKIIGSGIIGCTISGRPCASGGSSRDQVVVERSGDDERQGPNVCATKNICTPVEIFFGTDRKRQDTPERVSFGFERAQRLQLGRAFVTVPRSGRKVGEIPLPTWWDRWVLRVAKGGDPAKHFTIPKKGIVIYDSVEQLMTAVEDQRDDDFGDFDFRYHALVFVHGYNVSFDHALFRAAQIAYDVGGEGTKRFGTTFLYSWPSGGTLRGYKYDAESANFATSYVQEFLEMVIEQSGAKSVHIVAHSMGNDPVLKALDELRKKFPNDKKVKHLVLAAPDFDAKEFERIAGRIRPLTETTTLYASSKDIAMRASREAHMGFTRAGDVPARGVPVIVKDMDSIDISAISTNVLALAHSEYADRKELLNDIAAILRKGERPPNIRNIKHKLQGKDDGVWWRYSH